MKKSAYARSACDPKTSEVRSHSDCNVNDVPPSGRRRRSTTSKKRRSNLDPPGSSGSVLNESASLSFCGAAAQGVEDSAIRDTSSNSQTLHLTSSVPVPENALRNKSGTLFRVTDHSYDFEEPEASPEKPQKDPKWFPTPRQSKSVTTTKSYSKPCPTAITPQRMLEVLRANPDLAKMASAEDQASLLLPGIVQEVRDDCYNKGPPLQVKLVGVDKPTDIEQEFKQIVPYMDLSAEKLKGKSFPSFDLAYVALCQMIRSFVPNLCASIKETVERKDSRIMMLGCSTARHRKKGTDDEGCSCKWKARIVTFDGEQYSFDRIDSFGGHQKHCLMNVSRFVPKEITFQESLPSASRKKIMAQLKQTAADQATFTQRKHRDGLYLGFVLDKKQLDAISQQEIDWSVTSLTLPNPVEGSSEITAIPEETEIILKFLSLVKAEDNAQTFLEFYPTDPTIATVSFIWPVGAQLLASHSDVIFCDSMWVTTTERDFFANNRCN